MNSIKTRIKIDYHETNALRYKKQPIYEAIIEDNFINKFLRLN